VCRTADPGSGDPENPFTRLLVGLGTEIVKKAVEIGIAAFLTPVIGQTGMQQLRRRNVISA